MKKFNKIGGGHYFRLLCLAGILFSVVSQTWAQGGTAVSTAPTGSTTTGSGSSASANVDGYRIEGDANPKEAGQQYAYTRQMPDGSNGVYWYVAGAVAINGAPAKTYPAGRLDAQENLQLSIVWDLTGEGSPVLQLRRDSPEGKDGVEVLADLAVSAWPFTCTGHIEYYGRTNNPGSSGDRADQFLCPNRPIQTGPFLDDLFRYETPDCDYFIWTLKYNTASGNVYQEQWRHTQNRTAGRFALYTQVPLRPYSTYPQINPLTGLPSPDWVAHNYVPVPGPVQPQNALAGQNVLSIDVQCTGYRSILCNMSDEQHIYFTGVLGNIGAVTASGTGPFCRDQPVTISTSGSAGATANTRYNWTLLAGTFTGITGNGTSATLDFRSVPPTENTVTVQVQASDNSCGGAGSVSNTQSITLQLAPAAPQPQNMALTNGLCPGPGTKTVSVDLGNASQNALYAWSISGNGASFFEPANGGTANTTTIVTTTANPVTVTARKRLTTCGGFGPPLSTTYQIGNNNPTPPTGATLTRCTSGETILALQGTQPDFSYSYVAFDVLPGGTVTISSPANGPSATVVRMPNTSGVLPTQFRISVGVTSTCTAAGTPTSATWVSPALVFSNKAFPCGGTGTTGNKLAPPVLYPNPTTGQVTIAKEPVTAYTWVKVMNAQGQLKQEQQATSPQGITSLDVSALPTGIYLVQLFDGQHLTTQRLVKE